MIALAMFSGVRRGPQDLAEYAATLSQGQLRALGFRTQRGTPRIRCPGESTFQRVLPQVDAPALERALLLWQEQVLGPSQDKRVIVSRLHHALDVSLDDDRSRVRHPNAALVLGMFRRLVVSVAPAAIRQVRDSGRR